MPAFISNLVINSATVAGATAVSILLSLLLNSATPFITDGWSTGVVFLVVNSVAFNQFFWYRRNAGSFAELLIGGISIRFVLSLFFLAGLWLFEGNNFLYTALHFVTHYVVFSAAEIIFLAQLNRRK